MKKQWLLLLFLTLQCIARGQTGDQVTGYDCRLLVDGILMEQSTLTPAGGKVTWDADASALPVGLHRVTAQIVRHETQSATTMQYESIFYRVDYAPQATHQVEGYCYIDGNLFKQSTLAVDGGVARWDIDATALPVGLHNVQFTAVDRCGTSTRTDSYQSFFYRIPDDSASLTHEVVARCYVDDNLVKEELMTVDGGVAYWSLDMSTLPEGLHPVKVVLTDKTERGTMTSCYQSIFYHGAFTQEANHHLMAYCTVDGDLFKTEQLTVDGGKVQWMLDMSSLPVGLHNINVKVVDENEAATTMSYQSVFYRVPTTTDHGIVGYDYWVNQEYQGHGDVNPMQQVYLLDTLLSVTEQEIRSIRFHFAVEDDQPVVYAQNDLWVMFHDASGKEASAMGTYTDMRTRREVTDVILLQPGETATMTRPAENGIKWYKVEALAGDSLMFKTSKACTWQLFSPTGEELCRADGSQATAWSGTFTMQDGTHYVAVHDVTETGTSLTISYNHIDGHFALDEGDWEVLKAFYAQYGNGNFEWNLSDRDNVRDIEGVSIAIGRVVSIELPDKGLQGPFPTMLLGLSQLRLLDLSNNGLSGDAAAAVEQYVAQHDTVTINLQELNVANNDFEGNVGALASCMPQLTRLNADGNLFTAVMPSVSRNVTLTLNDQRLTVDGDLTRGMDAVIASIPEICYYDHRNSGQGSRLSVELNDATQNPEWELSLSLSDGQYWMTAPNAYRGVNGQAIAGSTLFTNGTWSNRQLLSGLFSFAMGDVNLTGDVDVTDLQALINYIFNTYNRPFNFTAANHRNDAVLNVQDVVGEVNILLAQNEPAMGAPRRASDGSDDEPAEASLYWSDGTLYIVTAQPVASLDVINHTREPIHWNLSKLGMLVSTASTAHGEHAVIYSMDDAVIPAGVTALATTTAREVSVTAAALSDPDANRISVSLNNGTDGLQSITRDEANCQLQDGMLYITTPADLGGVEVMICSIDGRVLLNRHIGQLQQGTTTVDVRDMTEQGGYYIIIVRSADGEIAVQKTTQIR